MLKKTITYEDYLGNVRTEDFYFNFSIGINLFTIGLVILSIINIITGIIEIILRSL